MGYRNDSGKYIKNPMPYAIEATSFLSKAVLGKECYFDYDEEEKDRYNRLLLFCFLDEMTDSINEDILRKGLAVVSFYPPNLKYKDRLLAAQEIGKKQGKGLWSLPRLNEKQAANYLGQVRAVAGDVESAYRGRNAVYLNFSKNYKTDFTVTIRRKSWKLFEEAGIDIEKDFLGKKILVSGKIREYNGPYIEVGLPGQIEELAN